MIATGVLALVVIAAAAPTDDKVTVLRPTFDASRLEPWRAAATDRPGLRGFRAPILDRAASPLVLDAPAGDGSDAKAARTIATQLARGGLRATLVAAVADLGPTSGSIAQRLESAGFPVDWLACWAPPGAEPLVERVVRELSAGRERGAVVEELASLEFAFTPTIPGWRVASESGEHEAAAIRLQVSSATDYARPGEGGAMDVFRDLARVLPDAALVVGVESKHLGGVEAEARALAPTRRGSITLVESPLPLAQWAQDNAKAGHVESGGRRSVAWLAPRYASRGEAGSTFVAGENLALEGFAATGRVVRTSPLLFQGGDLVTVVDPRSGKRSMLVGEAEIARNLSLGLTRDEVLAALRTEFGVDGCIVLPAASFHVDLEVSVRATDEGLVACVLDTATAARTVLHCGIDGLANAKLLDAEGARLCKLDVDEDRPAEFFERLGPILQRAQHGGGQFALDFSAHFAAGPTDSGVGNLQRFLMAVDLWTAARMGDASAEQLGIDADTHAYLSSLRRREADRMRVARALVDLGWNVVPVPGLSDEARSLNPLNGLHLRGRYLQPTYGGLYARIDELARTALTGAFGPGVRIDPIATGETQRRSGGLHCAASVEPAAN